MILHSSHDLLPEGGMGEGGGVMKILTNAININNGN
jgi:hypothetical protein